MIVNTSLQALMIRRGIIHQRAAMGRPAARIASGYRINSAADDAAGLTIVSRKRAQIISLHQAGRNIQDGISLSRTVSGALGEANDILIRMRELAVQAANGTITTSDRLQIQREFRQLGDELDRIATTTNFNGMQVLDGSASLVASTNSDLLSAYVDGANLQYADQVADRYLLDIETIVGEAQIKKSHILGLMNGTRAEDINTQPAGGEVSGLRSFSSTGLATGDYRIQTRAQPFGGIEFFNSDGDPADDDTVSALGLNDVRTTTTPDIMPAGEYRVETAAEVPFMAIFEDLTGSDIDLIRGVDPTNRDNIDVRMNVEAGQDAAVAQTEVAWTDIGGAGLGTIEETTPTNHIFAHNFTYQVDPNYDTNMYTHFRVEDLDPRRMLTENITAESSYVSAAGSQMQMELTYKSEAGAQVNMGLDYRTSADSGAVMNLTYETADVSEVGVTATYYSKAGEEIKFDTKHLLSAQTITIEINGENYNSDITEGSTLEEAVVQLNTDFDSTGVSFSVSEGDERHIIVENNSGSEITISDTADNEIGISSEDPLADGETRDGENLDQTITVDVGGNNIENIVEDLNDHTDLTAKGLVFNTHDNGDGTRRLTINNTGDYLVSIEEDMATDSVETELGLNSYSSEPNTGLWTSETSIFHGHTFSINIASQNIAAGAENVPATIQSAIDGLTVGDVSIADFSTSLGSHANDLNDFTITNESIYRLTFDDNQGGDWERLGLVGAVNERGNSETSNRVYHNHVFDFSVGSLNLVGLQEELQNQLSGKLEVDQIDNGSENVFRLDGSEGGLRRITVHNSGDDDTGYRIEVSNNIGTAISQLNLDTVIERGSDYMTSNSVYHNRTMENINVGDRDLGGIQSALQSALGDGLSGHEIADTNTEYTFFHVDHPGESELNRIEIRNTGDGNTSYVITLTDQTGGMVNQLNLGNPTDLEETTVSHGVYHNQTRTIDVGDLDLDKIREHLQSELQDAMNADEITNTNTQDTILREEHDPAGRSYIRVNNTGNSNTSYEITFTDVADWLVAQQLGLVGVTINREVDRNDNTAHRDYEFGWGVVGAIDDNIEQIFDRMNSAEVTSLGVTYELPLEASWNIDYEPDWDGVNFGRFQVQNTCSDPEKRRITLQGGGVNELFTGGVVLRVGGTDNTIVWQARDRIEVRTEYIGITNQGVRVEGDRLDLWWEGETGDLNPLVNDDDLGFTSIRIPDNEQNAIDNWQVGDAWTLFTQAHVGADHDRLDFHLEDGGSGFSYASEFVGGDVSDHGGGSYRFNNGVLDNSSMFIPQAVRTGVGAQESFDHRIQFGNEIETTDDAAIYKERYQASFFDHYAYAYYGNNTTYFFHDESLDPNDVFSDIHVWRQEDSNASLLFIYQGGGTFNILGRAYDRDGFFRKIEMTGVSLDASTANFQVVDRDDEDEVVIHFEHLNIDTSNLVEGDKFVINVAARAGHADSTITHGDLVYTDHNIAITGSPFMQEDRGSTMQYRFDQNAVNGYELNLLGYFVDPLFGGNDDIGVRTGQIILDVNDEGFAPETRVGGNQHALLEINYQGTTDHIAASLLTGHYFQDMEEGEIYYDFIADIAYEEQQQQNAAVVFEVIEEGTTSILLRGQAHIYSKDGSYRYEFEDYIRLGKENKNLTLFDNCGEGLTFSDFDFTDLSRLERGDRFSLSLAANAEPDDSEHDEVYLWGSDYLELIHPHSWRFDNGVLDHSLTILRTYQVSRESGEIFDSTQELRFGDFHGGTDTGIVDDLDTPRDISDTVRFTTTERRAEGMGPAHRYSRLKDIDFFWTPEGRYLIEEPVSFTINQGGKEARITLYGEDEVMDVIDRINKALYEDLEMHELVGETDRHTFATFVNHELPGSNLDVVEGTMVIRSAVPGQAGDLAFSGDEDILKALGMLVLRESEENMYNIGLRNLSDQAGATTNVKVSGNTAPGVLPGVNLQLDSILGIDTAEFVRCTQEFRYITSQESDIYVNLVDRRKLLQVGANPGQTARLDLGSVGQEALGIVDVSIITRDLANRAIAKIDQAIVQVSGQRSNLGALENRLEHNATNVAVAAENLTHAESRIRDADIAREFMQYIRSQLISQIGLSILGTYNMQRGSVLQLVH